MVIKEHDFIEIEYTGTLNDGTVFDTTSEAVAKKSGVHNPNTVYKPAIICVGEQQILPGLDKALVGKETGKGYTITLPPEQAFGKKDAKQIRLVPFRTFQKQNIMPQTGLQVNIDNTIATVLRVSGGRVLVDFNHPIAGKDVAYEITIKRIVTDVTEQIKSYIELVLPVKVNVALTDNKATITLPATMSEIPAEIKNKLAEKLKEVTQIEDITFKKEEQKQETNVNTTPK